VFDCVGQSPNMPKSHHNPIPLNIQLSQVAMGKKSARQVSESAPVAVEPRFQAPLDVRVKKFLWKNPVLSTVGILGVISWALIFFFSRGRVLSNYASEVGFTFDGNQQQTLLQETLYVGLLSLSELLLSSRRR
jgi:hypothetical protein